MDPVIVKGKVRKVGNSLAVLIPAAEARRAELREGQDVEVEVRSASTSLLGILKGVVPYREFVRSKEGTSRDDRY